MNSEATISEAKTWNSCRNEDTTMNRKLLEQLGARWRPLAGHLGALRRPGDIRGHWQRCPIIDGFSGAVTLRQGAH